MAFGVMIQVPPLLTFMTIVGQETIGDGTIIGTGTLAGVGTHGMDQTGVGDGIIGMEIPGAVGIISRIFNSTIMVQEVLPQLTTTKITVEIDMKVVDEIIHPARDPLEIITAELEPTQQSEIRDQVLISGHQEIQFEIAQT